MSNNSLSEKFKKLQNGSAQNTVTESKNVETKPEQKVVEKEYCPYCKKNYKDMSKHLVKCSDNPTNQQLYNNKYNIITRKDQVNDLNNDLEKINKEEDQLEIDTETDDTLNNISLVNGILNKIDDLDAYRLSIKLLSGKSYHHDAEQTRSKLKELLESTSKKAQAKIDSSKIRKAH